jgi:hypothetical protein
VTARCGFFPPHIAEFAMEIRAEFLVGCVKMAFISGHKAGICSEIPGEIIRASAEEQRSNPRPAPAKLRWAGRAND